MDAFTKELAKREPEAARELVDAEATIADLRQALSIVKAERDHWHALVPRADRVQFPFELPKNK